MPVSCFLRYLNEQRFNICQYLHQLNMIYGTKFQFTDLKNFQDNFKTSAVEFPVNEH